MLLAIIDHGGVRYYLLELIISTFDYVESHIQILLDIFIFYVLYVYLFTSTKCQLYIFDILYTQNKTICCTYMYKHGSNINTNVSIFVCLKIVKTNSVLLVVL